MVELFVRGQVIVFNAPGSGLEELHLHSDMEASLLFDIATACIYGILVFFQPPKGNPTWDNLGICCTGGFFGGRLWGNLTTVISL